MKKYAYIIISIITFIITLSIVSCNTNTVPVEKIVYVTVKDTISERTNIARIIELEHELNLVRDSLNMVKDSLGEDLFIANYKLGRIKYYTNIVDNKPTQIKFYKGWVKRVLNE